jgi:hypothetical protein
MALPAHETCSSKQSIGQKDRGVRNLTDGVATSPYCLGDPDLGNLW